MKTIFKPSMMTRVRPATKRGPMARASTKWTLLAIILLFGATLQGNGERVTPAEARATAQGWVNLIVKIKSHWGAVERPEVGKVVELRASDRVVGYYCPVAREGYVVVSSYTELNPVIAYSVRGSLDPNESRGPSGLVRDMLYGQFHELEQRIGPLDTARPEQFQTVLKHDHRPRWKKLQDAGANPAGISPQDASYQSGKGVLLSSSWDQMWPYNARCPADTCPDPNNNNHDLVGCVALSAAQIMKYWGYPDFWGFAIMPNTLRDANSPPTQDQIDAVAILCHAPGETMFCSYGCDGTAAWFYGNQPGETMEDNWKDHLLFDTDGGKDRSDYNGDDNRWWNDIVTDLNKKEPVQYKWGNEFQSGHVFVVDGWEVISTATHMVHVNYGTSPFAPSNDYIGWYSLDNLPDTLGSEGRLFNLRPKPNIGPTVYPMVYDAFSEWYFSEDASGANATFLGGNLLHFLPTVRLANNGGPSDLITFKGNKYGAGPTTLYAGGDPSKGIILINGELKIAGKGCLRLVPQVPPRFVTASHAARLDPYITVNWDRGYSDDQTTVIERSIPGGPWTAITNRDATYTVFYDTNVISGTNYIYRLRSSGTGGLSVPSDPTEPVQL